MNSTQATPIGDSTLTRADGRRVAWAEWGQPVGSTVLLIGERGGIQTEAICPNTSRALAGLQSRFHDVRGAVLDDAGDERIARRRGDAGTRDRPGATKGQPRAATRPDGIGKRA